MLLGFMITCPREYVSSCWMTFSWKNKKKLDYNIKIRECYVTHAMRFLTFSTSTNKFSLKYNMCWLMSWIKVKGLMGWGVREMLGIKKKLNKLIIQNNIEISSSKVFDPKWSSPYSTLLHETHKYTVQWFDPFGAKTSIPNVSIHITTHSDTSMNFI